MPVLSPPGPATGAKELFVNGGFESGVLGSAWSAYILPNVTHESQYASFKVVQPGLTLNGQSGGRYSFQYTDEGKRPGNNALQNIELSQQITGLQVGSVYVLELSYNATAGFGGDISLSQDFEWVLNANLCQEGACSGIFRRPLVAHSDTIFFNLQGFLSTNTPATITLDNFSLKRAAQ